MASGQYMQVDGVARAMRFNLNDSKSSPTSSASNNKGGTTRGGGIRRWGGAFGAHGGSPTHMPNKKFTFSGYFTPTNGTEGGDGNTASGPAIINQTVINWNWGVNERVTWVSNFLGRVGLTYSETTPTLDTAASVDDFACGAIVEYSTDGGTTWIEIPKLNSATLTFTAAVVPEVNSSTSTGGICYEDYDAGIIDWTFSANQQDHKRGVSGYPDLGAKFILRPKINGTDSFTLKYGTQLEYTNQTADRTTNTPIGRTINIGMESNNAGIGHIYTPDQTIGTDTPWWGTA